MKTFERLISEAERQPFSGWDFCYLEGRYEQGRISWDFGGILLQRLKHAESLLDLGTGGGEFLSSLSPLPSKTCATEGYPPNALVARRRLQPLGVDVVQTYSEDNGKPGRQIGSLPFRDSLFDLVMDRHESYVASEVHRVLKPGGVFATQQVGDGNNAELHDFLQGRGAKEERVSWNLNKAIIELQSSGFGVQEQRAKSTRSRFLDVGAIVYYLKSIPWEIPGFEGRKYTQKLRELDRRIRSDGLFEVTTTRFLVIARKELVN